MVKHTKYNNLQFLPLVKYTEGLFSKNYLSNVFILACQHILPSTHMMIRSMINLGLDVNKIAIIGKCYSTNQTVMKNMIREGIFVCESSKKFDSNMSFDEQFRNSINSFLRRQIARMKPDKNSTIIILDDGAELISAAQNLIDFYPNVFGVEQTSSGYHKLAYTSMNFPVKNIALSKEKLNLETPLIAQSILNNLEQKLSLESAEHKEILIVGNGYVGEAMSGLLNKKKYGQHKVTKYDIVQEKSDIDYVDFSNFDLIIGATGNMMMTHNYYPSLKKNTTLVSVSSSDREFDAVNFRKLSGRKFNTHEDVHYNNIRLLNCGFPINFSGEDRVSVSLDKIQLVCSLLLLGVCECITCSKHQKQFVKLDKNATDSILEKFSVVG